jgi:hypothetical protein
MRLTAFRGAFALAILAVCLAGCAQTREMRSDSTSAFSWSGDTQKRIVMMPPDVVLAELTAGGVTEPRADWTKSAQDSVIASLGGALAQKGIDVVQADALTDPHDVQIEKLHNAVGGQILLHGFGLAKLPTKGTALDWTLGPGARTLRDKYKADYAMFVFVRDSYSTAGRRAVQLFAAMLGATVQGGLQVAFVSVVDLRTGNVVWFNFLVDQYGDLRDAKGTANFTAAILKGNPL